MLLPHCFGSGPLPTHRRERKPTASAAHRPVKIMGLPMAAPRPLNPRLFQVHEHTLANGLSVRLLADDAAPTVSLYTFFRVGSRNERPGITGIAHLFEHMMFNGAQKYGPKEFDRLLESNGGHSNAYTSHDVTVYYEDFASEALNLVLDLESDRMRSLTITAETLASEREVVKEERRFSVENHPLGLLDEELFSLSYTAHPYRWPVIGWMQDIENISRQDCLDFFRAFYAPNNAVLWVVGNFDISKTLALIESFYGDIGKGPGLPPVVSTEPLQRGERRGEVLFPAHAAALAVSYRAPPAASADVAVLDVIQYALAGGEGGRLVKKLVYDKLVATNIIVDYTWRIDPSLLVLLAELNPKTGPARALEQIDRVLEQVSERGFAEKELLRAKGQLRAQSIREMATHHGRAHMLGTGELLMGDWRAALQMPERYAAVTNDDVQRVARDVFQNNARSIVTLIPTDHEEVADHG